ncbi:MAG: GNAT family N-acetyltransferase [Actinomycetota bacterium]|nr:GNAT family N-acetyltransferase [Actinomycetota bacterium]
MSDAAFMDDGPVIRVAGREAAPALALLWVRAEARRKGETIPSDVDASAVDALRSRLDSYGAVAVVAVEAGEPVAGCFATQALEHDEPVHGRAHVSGISVMPERWGEGLGRHVLARLEGVLLDRGYDAAQLIVLETNDRARRLYELAGWRLVSTGEPHPAGPHAVYEKTLG